MDTLADLDFDYYYRVYDTIHKMMADRGYTPKKAQLSRGEYISAALGLLAEETDDPFVFVDKLSLIFTRDSNERLLVYFYILNAKLCKVDMEHIDKLMKAKKTNQLVMVTRDQITPRVSSVLTILGPTAQVFHQDALVNNITKHQLVPEHTLLTSEEKQAVLEYYRVKDRQLPAIFTTDAVVQYYNWPIGSLIKILRPSKQAGFYDVYYRIVAVQSKKK